MKLFILFRIFFVVTLLKLLDVAIGFDTSFVLLALSSVAGILLSAFLNKKINSYGAFGFIVVFSILIFPILNFSSQYSTDSKTVFSLLTLIEHLKIFIYVFIVSFVTSWLTIKYKIWVTIESLLLILTTIFLHANHRDFHLEFPKFIQTISWEFNLSVLTTLILVTAIISIVIISYFFTASFAHASISQSNSDKTNSSNVALTNYLKTLLFSLPLIILGSVITYNTFFEFTQAGGRTSNGVGQAAGEGSSPLGFHSALGGSNEPAALVRIDGDYKNNPFTPMLYIRESALSQMGKNELLLASQGFDTDVPRISTSERYTKEIDKTLPQRLELSQSVYLISPHKAAFGIDYPISIVPLKNPNTTKFKGAYKVLSMVPQVRAAELGDDLVIGDPNWTKLEWEHFLQTHQDKRYAELALKITQDAPTSLSKIVAVTTYLSKNATYTLTPNHEVPAGGDSVEPFLFGDMRGYCVHFAHATVYMLRSLGIPARIGTGYLTDLSQAKDSHILLRMSDRHAWAEVYIKNLGWVPFDTQPEKVESHADTQVDLNMLEDLMSELEPDEEILPKDITKDEKNVAPEKSWEKPDFKILIKIIILILLILILLKLYLRYSWVFHRDPLKVLNATNLSLNARLLDLGFTREYGTTRKEFKETLIKQNVINSTNLTEITVPVIYSKENSLVKELTPQKIIESFRQEKQNLKNLPFLTKVFSIITLRSPLTLGMDLIFKSIKSIFTKSNNKNLKLLIILGVIQFCHLSIFLNSSHADISDTLIESDLGLGIDENDVNKTPEELVNDASDLLLAERPIDARVKLLDALKKDPKYFKAHALLAEYYIQQVGHFRLALKYTKRALELFTEKNGPPPYESDYEVRAYHSYLLYLLTQTRLNLDNYQGALDTLDEYASYDYYGSWYPNSRSWILMKLGRIKDAIQVARAGIMSGVDEGRTLNMLGILLSMDNEKEMALKVLKEAINYELDLGDKGQPATPLNNIGEVYREMFEDDKAESSWRKAVRLPDGCEHMLPTLNLTILLNDQLRFHESTQAINEFLDCVKQFPLRNDEEHRALVDLSRARISLLSGDPSSAIDLLEKSLEGTQWFGKIGTSQEDLKVGIYSTMYQALLAKQNHLKSTAYATYSEWMNALKDRFVLSVKSWWSLKKTRQLLTETLLDFEDLNVRHTDSLLDYGSLGDIVGKFSPKLVDKKITALKEEDSRELADNFYQIYLAESYFNSGYYNEASSILAKTLPKIRQRYDERLILSGEILNLKLIERDYSMESIEYINQANKIYSRLKAALRNSYLKLPIKIETNNSEVRKLILGSIFYQPDQALLDKTNYSVTYSLENNIHILTFKDKTKNESYSAKDKDIHIAFNKFLDKVFGE